MRAYLQDAERVAYERLQRLGAEPPLRIALTGGPTSGKTETAALMAQQLKRLVHRVGEAATHLIACGIRPGEAHSGEKTVHFQQHTAMLQLLLETAALAEAAYEKKSFVLHERGLLDGVAYHPGGAYGWERDVGVSVEAALRRYDLVIYLEMPTEEIFYRVRENNASRVETEYSQACALAERTKAAWCKHAHFQVVPAMESWEAKVRAVHNVLVALAVQRQIHV